MGGAVGDGETGGREPISRRRFFALSALAVVAACSSDDEGAAPTSDDTEPSNVTAATGPATASEPSAVTSVAPTTPALELAADPFLLGVASGDPDATSVILWTRLVLDAQRDAVPAAEEIEVGWELAGDEAFTDVTASGTAAAEARYGYSVHVEAPLTGRAWYRFHAGGWTSATGRTSSAAPDAAAPLRIASASCQHWETGFYAAYRDLVEQQPDLVVFLGDYIYEGAARPVGGAVVRSHEGPEPTDLVAYRNRYAHYRSDANLRAAHAACPWVVTWDDHEVENNYAGLVPQDPADAAGFPARRAAAYQAWWEHMPVRLPAPTTGALLIHRQVSWGTLADVLVLDGRQFRSDQACGDITLSTEPACAEAHDPERTMLGGEQQAWVDQRLGRADATWNVIAQQVVMTDLSLPNGAILNFDQWDGYSPAREELLSLVRDRGVQNLVVLTGDIHLAGASYVTATPGDAQRLGVELTATSISSLGIVDASLTPLLAEFPTVVDVELTHRGYLIHTVTPESWTAEYRIVEDALREDSAVTTWRTFRVDAGTTELVGV